MNGVDGYVDKFFKGSRRVGFVLVSSRHVIFVQKCCVSSRAVDVGGKVRKRTHYYISVWNATKCKRTSSSLFTIYNSMHSAFESIVAPYLKNIADIDNKGALGRLDVDPFAIVKNLVPSTLVLPHQRDAAAVLMLPRSYLFWTSRRRIAEQFKWLDPFPTEFLEKISRQSEALGNETLNKFRRFGQEYQ